MLIQPHTFFFIDPPLQFFAGLAGTTVAGVIPISGVSDAVGNIVKQGILWIFGDHKIDVGDFSKDVLTGAGMGFGGMQFLRRSLPKQRKFWRKLEDQVRLIFSKKLLF